MTKYENFGKFRLGWWQRFVKNNRRTHGIYRFKQRGAICHRFDDLSDLAGIYERCIQKRRKATIKISSIKKTITFLPSGEVEIGKDKGGVLCQYQ